MRPAWVLLAFVPCVTAGQRRLDRSDQEPRPLGDRLYDAVRDGKVETVRTLLAKGANPNLRLGYADSLLCGLGGTPDEMLAIAKLLVARGAKVNPPQSGQGYTPLINAIHRAQEPVGLVRYLLLKGANPNAAIDVGMTPLHFAVNWGHLQSARMLLAHGARLDARTNDNGTVRADQPGLEPYVRRDVEKRTSQMEHIFEPGYRGAGETPVFGLAQRWNPAMADLLLKAGASLKTTDVNGWTPLHHAAKWGIVAAVQGLLARGANPNAASKGGFRPLHLAMRAGYGFPEPNTVRALLAKGADPKLKNRAGQTPLDLLRADVGWRVSNPTHDPELAFPPQYLAGYQAAVDAAAKALDPNAARIVVALPRPDPKGQRYAPLELIDGEAERTVRVENGEAVLELRLPPLAKGKATLTVKEIALEEYDTLTPLPMVVKRVAGVPNVLTFRFPKGAARGGAVNLAADQEGPGEGSSGSMGQTSSEGETDNTHPQPGFRYGNGVSVMHDVPDRIMEFEIVAVRQGGKSLPSLAGTRVLVPSERYVPVPGLTATPSDGPRTLKTHLDFRFRYLPNVKWRRGSIDL